MRLENAHDFPAARRSSAGRSTRCSPTATTYDGEAAVAGFLDENKLGVPGLPLRAHPDLARLPRWSSSRDGSREPMRGRGAGCRRPVAAWTSRCAWSSSSRATSMVNERIYMDLEHPPAAARRRRSTRTARASRSSPPLSHPVTLTRALFRSRPASPGGADVVDWADQRASTSRCWPGGSGSGSGRSSRAAAAPGAAAQPAVRQPVGDPPLHPAHRRGLRSTCSCSGRGRVAHKSTLWYWGGRIALLSSSLPIAAFFNRNPQSFGRLIGTLGGGSATSSSTALHIVVAAIAVDWNPLLPPAVVAGGLPLPRRRSAPGAAEALRHPGAEGRPALGPDPELGGHRHALRR